MKTLFDFRDCCKILHNNNEFIYKLPEDLSLIFTDEIPNEIYVVTGPGSYTGIRKALSIAYALSDNVYGICILRDIMKQNYSFYVEKDKIVYLLKGNEISIHPWLTFKGQFSSKQMMCNVKSDVVDWKFMDCSSEEIYKTINNLDKKSAQQDYFDKFVW